MERYRQPLAASCAEHFRSSVAPYRLPGCTRKQHHLRIPPAAHTFQSAVETVHRLVEDEFFDLESFTSRGDFLAKAFTYQLYFNLVRPNTHKHNLSPWQIFSGSLPAKPSLISEQGPAGSRSEQRDVLEIPEPCMPSISIPMLSGGLGVHIVGVTTM